MLAQQVSTAAARLWLSADAVDAVDPQVLALGPVDRGGRRGAGARRPGRLPADGPRRVLAARALGIGVGRALRERARRWAPCRTYAVQHLWAVGDHAVDHLPLEAP